MPPPARVAPAISRVVASLEILVTSASWERVWEMFEMTGSPTYVQMHNSPFVAVPGPVTL
jgi:hypothetical protein